MASNTITIPVTVTQQGSVIDIKIKPVTHVPNNSDEQQLQWKLQGSPGWSFPSSDYFNWKTGSGQPQVSQSATQLTAAGYVNDDKNRRRWEYMIAVTNGTLTINIDPEVDNQPPTPGTGEEKP